MSQEKLNAELAAVEAVLLSLKPKPSSLERDRVLFLAGRASLRRRGPGSWLWPCATAASLLAAVTLGGVLLVRGGPNVVERVVYIEATAPTGESTVAGDTVGGDSVGDWPVRKELRTDYLQLRRLVLTEGVDALPELRATPAADTEIPKWRPGLHIKLEELLGS